MIPDLVPGMVHEPASTNPGAPAPGSSRRSRECVATLPAAPASSHFPYQCRGHGPVRHSSATRLPVVLPGMAQLRLPGMHRRALRTTDTGSRSHVNGVSGDFAALLPGNVSEPRCLARASTHDRYLTGRAL